MKTLVVEDDLGLRTVLARALARENHQVQTAENGSQALELLRRERFDAVVTDFMLGDMTGEDVAKAAKELHPETRILLISGLLRQFQWADKFLMKPFDLDKLLEFINES